MQVISTLKRTKIVILSSFALFFLFFTLIGGIKFTEAKDGAFCVGFGTSGMSPKTSFININNATLKDLGYRKYNINEIFSSSAFQYSIPFGHKDEGGFFGALTDNTSLYDTGIELDDIQKNRIESYGNKNGMCFIYGAQPTLQETSKRLTSVATTVISWLTSTLFDPGFICENPDNPTGGCINLLGILGGTKNGNGGLVGVLSRGIFLPLSTLAFLVLAVWLMYEGLYKKQFRSSFQGIAWSLFAFGLGVVILIKPWFLVRAPQNAMTMISSCIVQGMNGRSCLGDGGSETIQYSSNKDITCVSASLATNSTSQQMLLDINGMSCKITKGFLIDRWAEEQFGYSFDELYTMNNPEGTTVYPAEKLQGNPEDYCVNMYNEKSPKELYEGNIDAIYENRDGDVQIKFNDTFNSKVCNIALAYMSNNTIGDFGTKAEMQHIIATAAKDAKMWSAFTGNGRSFIDFFTFVATILIVISYVPIVFYAHIFSLTATLLTFFAPIFVLIAIHPGKGRKIFLGWIETIISSCLKFSVSGLFALIVLMIYSAVVSSLSSIMVFIVTLILTGTFAHYRKEILQLFGSVNMGGQKLSNKFGEQFEKLGQKAKHIGSAVVGGAVGGAMAGDMMRGAKEGLAMEMRRGRSFSANAFRQYNRISDDLARNRKEAQKEIDAEKRRQEMLDALKDNSKNISDTLENNQLNSEISSTLNRIDNAIDNTHVSAIQDNLSQHRNNVSMASSRAEYNSAMQHSSKAVNEAKYVSTFFNNNEDAVVAQNNYIKDFERKLDVVANDTIKKARASDEFKDMSNQEFNEYVEKYIDKLKTVQDNSINQIKENFRVDEVQKVVSSIDLEELNNISYNTQRDLANFRVTEISNENQFKMPDLDLE